MGKKIVKGIFKVLLAIVGFALGLFLLVGIVNFGCNLLLRNYIKSFEPAGTNRAEKLVPTMDEDGYYKFTTDDDFYIMHLTDIHIGGGFWTYKKDKKTIYEVMTMLQSDKPDLVILGGDNVFAVPGPMFNGGNTLNNKMAARTVIEIFNHAEVYFSTVFGNHDTEAFDYFDRQSVANLYMKDKFKYCIFHENFTDKDAKTVPSVTNQFIKICDSTGNIRKLILLIDTNAYIDTSIKASMDWLYDTIHPAQIEWAKDTVKALSKSAGLKDGEYLKTLAFLHIPTGEYQAAYDELFEEVKNEDNTVLYIPKENPINTVYESGIWDEDVVCYGGYKDPVAPEDADQFFEVMHDELNSLEAVFCGHDHINNSVVYYKGVMLSYGYSLDNIAYDEIADYGAQRGCTIITLHSDATFEQLHKNLYTEYACDPLLFVNTDATGVYYPEKVRTIK